MTAVTIRYKDGETGYVDCDYYELGNEGFFIFYMGILSINSCDPIMYVNADEVRLAHYTDKPHRLESENGS